MLRRFTVVFIAGTALFAISCSTPPPKPPIEASALGPGPSETVAVDHLVLLVDASSSVDRNTEFRHQKSLVEVLELIP